MTNKFHDIKVRKVQATIRDVLMDLGSGAPFNIKEKYLLDSDCIYSHYEMQDQEVWQMLKKAGVSEQHDEDRTYIIDGIEYEIVLKPKAF